MIGLNANYKGQVSELVKDGAPVKEIVSRVEDFVSRNKMSESEVVVLLWNTLMNSIEWNKKEELVAEQAFETLERIHHTSGYIHDDRQIRVGSHEPSSRIFV